MTDSIMLRAGVIKSEYVSEIALLKMRAEGLCLPRFRNFSEQPRGAPGWVQ